MIAKDKQFHFIAGVFIAFVVGAFSSPLLGFVAATLAGLVKDFVYDRALGLGHFEWMDIVWTIFGGLVSTSIMIGTQL